MKTFHPALLTVLVAFAASSAFAEGSARFANSSNFAHSSYNPLYSARVGASATSRIPAPLKVSFTLTAQGEPTAIRVLSGTGNTKVDEQCVAALAQTRRQPKVVNGVAVASEELLILNPTFKS